MKDLHSSQCPNNHHTLGHLILHGFYRNITKLRPITANNIIFLNNFLLLLLPFACHLYRYLVFTSYMSQVTYFTVIGEKSSVPHVHLNFILFFSLGLWFLYILHLLCSALLLLMWLMWFMAANKSHSRIIHLRSNIFYLEILIYFIRALALALAPLANLRTLSNRIEIRLWNSTINIFLRFLLAFPCSNFGCFVGPPSPDVDDDDQRAVNQMKHLQFHQAFISLNTKTRHGSTCIQCIYHSPFTIHGKLLNHMDYGSTSDAKWWKYKNER